MLLMRKEYFRVFALMALAIFFSSCCHAQAALLMEQPYGFFGTLNPTGHNAIYFERICAETPVKLRRCQPGEPGAVIARYQGINGYDWIAIPLIPYLYSVEDAAEAPDHVDREEVMRLRSRYREAHLESLGDDLPKGSFLRGGWTQLLGAAYERRTYAFRFDTTPEQDDALIAEMNAGPNRSHFNLLFNNCADFARVILNSYFPRSFRRSIFPDAGITTPKSIAYKLKRYALKHPEVRLTVFEIPQVPGYRRKSRSNKSISESLTTTAYIIPIVLVNPYLAGGLFADYLVRGHYHLIPSDPEVLSPDNFSALTAITADEQNPESAGAQAPGAAGGFSAETGTTARANSGLEEIRTIHE
ncbi:MAG TPA: hypothetical protein VMW15_01895 [Terracidiphilus sp.]|jgi:hypothetical protein|nr:hypothetical protein [Terracidiphilus sp.]